MTAVAAPVFIQGMRRSGTTILYDLLCEDPALRCFYEPLAAGKPSIGGGSGLRDTDVFDSLRHAREAFAAQRPDLVDVSLLNHGAPRDWRLEFERDLPPLIRDYLRFLLAQHDAVAMKFTRMACKVPVLAELAPDARFIHVVRDPRAVTSSYLLGRRHRRREALADPDVFFGAVSDWTQWSSREFSQHLLGRDGYPAPDPCRDFERILLIWRHTFEETHRGRLEAFGDRSMVVRNEDLRARPAETVRELYAFLERPLPQPVADLAVRAVRAEQAIVAPDDPRWREAYERLGMVEAVAAAGY